MSLYNSRHHTEMHGFIVGSTVIERDDPHKEKRTVIGIGGDYKDDHIKLDKFNSPWEISGNYLKINNQSMEQTCNGG